MEQARSVQISVMVPARIRPRNAMRFPAGIWSAAMAIHHAVTVGSQLTKHIDCFAGRNANARKLNGAVALP
jgi:hypothetical protein